MAKHSYKALREKLNAALKENAQLREDRIKILQRNVSLNEEIVTQRKSIEHLVALQDILVQAFHSKKCDCPNVDSE